MGDAEPRIRPAYPSEARVLTRVAWLAKAHWGYPEAWMETWRDDLTRTPEFVERYDVFVAQPEVAIAGWIGLRPDSLGRMQVSDLWVLPEWIGRGIGKALFLHAKNHLKTRGYAHFFVESDPNAAAFYEKLGGERVGEYRYTLHGVERCLPEFRFDV